MPPVRRGATLDGMHKAVLMLVAMASLLVAASSATAVPVNKCIVDGTVTFQSDPCPSGQVRKPPTVQELNAHEKKRRETAPVANRPAAIAAGTPSGSSALTDAPEAPAAAPTPTGFHCDGRRRCSQMSSCAEAKYFLANCPGVEMDGDHNGIPCERQWCNR